MAQSGRASAAMDAYRCAAIVARRDQAIADAEDIVAHTWVAELDQVRSAVLTSASAAQSAYVAARALVQAAQRAGRLDQLAAAQERLGHADDERRRNLDIAVPLLDAVDGELDLVGRASRDREVTCRANRLRVLAAWEAAHGWFPAGSFGASSDSGGD